MDKVPKKFA